MPKPHRSRRPSRLQVVSVFLALAVVLSIGTSGATGAGPWKRDTTPPTVPGNLRVTAASTSSVGVAWSASNDNTGVAGYIVSSDQASTKVTASTLQDTITRLACGSTVGVDVVAYDRAGNRSAPASTDAATSPCADTQPPTAPANVVVSGRTATSVSVSWSASTDDVGVVSYGVYKGTTLTATTTSTSATVSGLTCGTSVSLAVDAVDAAGNRSAQTPVSAATVACDTTPPPAPTGLAASNVTQTGATLGWTGSSDAASYTVYNGTSSAGTTSQTSYSLSALTCGTTYTVAVDAVDAAGNRSGKTSTSVTTATCSTTPPPPPPSSSEPAAIAGQGYHLAFDDEFSTLDRSTWDDHIWYDDAPSSSWTGFQQVDSNGILHLRTGRDFLYSGCSSNCYPINTITTQSSGKTFLYGYFEAKMKWSGGHGAWPGFWLYSYKHATDTNQCTTQAGEIDVMEGQGSEPDVFYGTVHSNTNGCSPADQQNGNNWQPVGVDLTAGYHTYGVLWTSTAVSWYLDDKLVMSAPTYTTDNQPMFLLLQMWSGGWTYDPDSSTPDTIETDVDYVHVWQK
jgi:chitodextrinase